jgi:gliding motility-associated-like protein
MRWLFARVILFLLAASIASYSYSQYILNGTATQDNCNCYTLTQPLYFQNGSVWNSNKIDLLNSFDFHFNVNLGCLDANGADGIVFILQPISTSIGTAGEGMGFEGITPSIGISLDTWQNLNRNDSSYDHISIQSNGYITHDGNPNNLTGQIQASASGPNIEDCQWHVLRISWDAVTYHLRVYFDGVIRADVQKNLVADIFNNNPLVYWGFSGATGGAVNLQQFCTALNPNFISNPASNAVCVGNPISFFDSSESFTSIQSYFWDLGDGTTSTLQNPPQHLYMQPGNYDVRHVITGMDGCVSDTIKKTEHIGSFPVAAFNVFDTCKNKPVRITDLSTNNVGNINQWTWVLDGTVVSTSQSPIIPGLNVGSHQLKLFVSSEYGCPSDTASKSFNSIPIPQVNMNFSNGCLGQPVQFNAVQLDNLTNVVGWQWSFPGGGQSTLQNPIHVFSSGGNLPVELTAMATNGCESDPVTKNIFISFLDVSAGNDTIVLQNTPFLLHTSDYWTGSSPLIFQWSPATGLDNPNVMFPTATIQDDTRYIVTVTSQEGCRDIDTVYLKVFKGSAIYVPTGFTPNHDGKNDLLRPAYVGIKSLQYFKVFNRWGELVFETEDMGKGWDGNFQGKQLGTGTFVWVIAATDYVGKKYNLKGTTTIIR